MYLVDLDGTLIDSDEHMQETFTRTCRELRVRPTHDVIPPGGDPTVVLPDKWRTGERFVVFGELYWALYEEHLTHVKPYPGSIELLHNHRVAVVTNKPQRIAELETRFLHLNTPVIGYGRPGVKRKPNPDLLHIASAALGVPIGCLVMVGDLESDMLAGHAAGTRETILVSRDETPRQTRAHRVVPCLTSLL